MADPQTENGYVKIANELFDALTKTHLSGQESRVLMAIMRKTYGFNKTWDRIAYSQITDMTGMLKQNVHRTIKLLIDRKMVERLSVGQGYKMRINKNYDQWIGCQGGNLNRLLSSKTITVIKTDTKLSSKQITTKDNTKDNYMSSEKLPNGAVKNFFIEWNSTMKDVKVGKIKFIDEIHSKHKRYKAVTARLKEPFFKQNYQEAMKKVANSDFCNGRILQDDKSPWVANIDWFLRPDKVMEIMEDRFDNSRWSPEPEPMRREDVPV